MKYRNKKNQKIYTVIDSDVLDVTGNKEVPMVYYKSPDGQTFVRESSEFFKKFDSVITL